MRKDARKAFTLVEMLIVIIVIGILAGLMMISSGSATDKAEETRCVADRRSIRSAINIYRAEHWSYDGFGDKLKDMFDNYHGSDPVDNKISGICPSGGIYIITSEDERITLSCSVHNRVSDSNIAESLIKLGLIGTDWETGEVAKYLAGIDYTNGKKYFDYSPGNNQNDEINKIISQLERDLKMSLTGYSVMAVAFSSNTKNYSVYIYPGDISKLKVGNQITVTKYETSTGKTSTMTTTVGQTKVDGKTVNVINHIATADGEIAVRQ